MTKILMLAVNQKRWHLKHIRRDTDSSDNASKGDEGRYISVGKVVLQRDRSLDTCGNENTL